jgi:hypothetical protein
VPALRREVARHRGTTRPMRAIFITYLVVIVTGLAYFTVIGLSHH